MQKKRSIIQNIGLFLSIVGVGTVGVVYSPLLAQELLGEPEVETSLETDEAQEDTEGLKTPVVDISSASTTTNPEIPVEELALLLKPMTLEELQVEAAAWFELLREKTLELSQAELAVRKQNRQIGEAQEAVKAIEKANRQVEQTQEQGEKAATTGATPPPDQIEQQAKKAEESVQTALEKVEEAAQVEVEVKTDDNIQEAVSQAKTDILTEEVTEKAEAAEEQQGAGSQTDNILEPEDNTEAPPPLTETESEVLGKDEITTVQADVKELSTAEGIGTDEAGTEVVSQKLEEASDKLEAKIEEQAEVKKEILFNATEIRDQHIALADRFRTVLDALENKGGETQVYRRYVNAVNEVEVDATDSLSFWITVWGWLRSDEGGLRWSQNLLQFSGIFGGFAILAFILGKIVDRSLQLVPNMSDLFRSFLVTFARRTTLVVGLCVGLTALEISLGPLLALVGGASFILAFALQSNLGNFASGLMILLYKPFDIGDEIKVDEISGRVDSISLASTKITELPNHNTVIIPNTTVWENTIVNYTHNQTRKVLIPVYISYQQDINPVKQLLRSIAREHPLALSQPEPDATVTGYHESGLELHLGLWVNQKDYWQVYQDLLHLIQSRFLEQHIEFMGAD